MVQPIHNGELLSSWKEIAAFLRCSVRTCLRWEREGNLPVHRSGNGLRSRVYAYKQDLDDWLKRNPNHQAAKATPSPLSKTSRIRIPAAAAIIVITGLSLLIFRSAPKPPADFRIEGSILIALDSDGRELWPFDTGLKNLCDTTFYRGHFQKRAGETDFKTLPLLMIRDLDGDGAVEVLLAAVTNDKIGGGDLFCLSQNGDLRWVVPTGREISYGSLSFPRDFHFQGIDVFDLDSDGKKEIVAISNATIQFPTRLLVLAADGGILGEYWHAGQLCHFDAVDLDEDGALEIIASGTNEDFKEGCLIVLDPGRISGGSPPSGPAHWGPDIGPGSERYYIRFPRTDVDLFSLPNDLVRAFDLLSNRRLRIYLHATHNYVELNSALEPVLYVFSDTFRQMHKEAVRRGEVASVLDEAYRLRMLESLQYWDGDRWVMTPTMNKFWVGR